MKTDLLNFKNLWILIEDQCRFQIFQYSNLYRMFLEHQLQKNPKVKLHYFQYYYYFFHLKSFFKYLIIFIFLNNSNQQTLSTVYLLSNISQVFPVPEIFQNNYHLIQNQIYLIQHNLNQILIMVSLHLASFFQINPWMARNKYYPGP